MSMVNDIVTLINDNWRLFQGEVDRSVYEKQNCSLLVNKRTCPKWFFKADKFLCIGCSKKCSLVRPTGFQANLEILYPEKAEQRYTLTPQEMLERYKLLTVDQAAYCLNVSPGRVYKLISMSELASLDSPKRVPAEEVRSYIERQIDV